MFKLKSDPDIAKIAEYLPWKVAESLPLILPPLWGQTGLCEALFEVPNGARLIAATMLSALEWTSGVDVLLVELQVVLALVGSIGGFLTQDGEIGPRGKGISATLLQPGGLQIGEIIRNPKILEQQSYIAPGSLRAARIVLELVTYEE